MSEAITAHCMKCKCRRTIPNPVLKLMGNGRFIKQGLCPICGSKVNKIISRPKEYEQKHPCIDEEGHIVGEQAFTEPVIAEPPPVEPQYRGVCRRCGHEVNIFGRSIGRHYTGGLVVQGKCENGHFGNMLNAREIGTVSIVDDDLEMPDF